MFAIPNGRPGVLTNYTATPREVFYANRQLAQFMSPPMVIDSLRTSWAENTPYVWQIPAGMLMGRVTSNKKYASSIIGVTTAGYASTGAIQVSASQAVELVRRVGTTGSVKVTGPVVSGGTVRTVTYPYTSVDTTNGFITVTATGTSAANATHYFNLTGTGLSGNVTLLNNINGTAVTGTISATGVQALADTIFGTGATTVQATGSLSNLTVVYTGTFWQTNLPSAVTCEVFGNGLAGTSPIITETFVQSGTFVTGSLIQPTDGSETITTVLCDVYGVQVVDQLLTNRTDVFDARLLLAGGTIDTGYLINYSNADVSVRNWIKAALRAACGGVTFRDDFVG